MTRVDWQNQRKNDTATVGSDVGWGSQMAAKSPCRPSPDTKRPAPSAPSWKCASTPLLHSQRCLREPGDIAGHLFRVRSGSTRFGEPFAQADPEGFLSRDFAPGQDDLHRPAVSYQPLQAYRPAV